MLESILDQHNNNNKVSYLQSLTASFLEQNFALVTDLIIPLVCSFISSMVLIGSRNNDLSTCVQTVLNCDGENCTADIKGLNRRCNFNDYTGTKISVAIEVL